jgi:2-polyprenyl-6-hydroxyphenyl methylase/3-demethylubiquinone-9 3-methyltransferase
VRAVKASILQKQNIFVEYKKKRGMSITNDWIDWLGGFPYEFARVEDVLHFLQDRGFVLKEIKTTNGLGNNQFVFYRN